MHRVDNLGQYAQKGGTPWNKGKKLSEAHREALRKPKSIKHVKSPEHLAKIGNAIKGTKNHFWKGGITEQTHGFYRSPEYRKWRRAVLKRDGNECVKCSTKVTLEAHHIKPRYLYPELRLDVNNGQTLCRPCHIQTDSYGGLANA